MSSHRMINPGTMPSLVAMFFRQAEKLGAKPFLHARGKTNAPWRSLTWDEAADRVRALAAGLRARGIEPGDRVALVSENRPEWLIADLGIMAAGAITVPAYTTNTTEDHLYLLADSGAKAAIVSTPALAQSLAPALARAAGCRHLIAMEPLAAGQDINTEIHAWDDLCAETPIPLHEGVRTDTACIIYTSGTGGAPKGVMLSHGAILANCEGVQNLFGDIWQAREAFLSFLPLSHSYEHTGGQFFPISLGAEIYYAGGLDSLGQDMMDAHPTIMTAVPRLYEVLKAQIGAGLKRASPFKQSLFQRTLELGRKAYETPDRMTLVDKFTNFLLDHLVRAKVRARFGGDLRFMVSGGAPLNYEVGVFFMALGIRILQGYGQTEAAPVISCNPPAGARIDTVGPPLAGVTLKIAEDGEILVRGELVMQGYWNKPDATKETVRDGWLHTGDIGVRDADGFVKITDRKKDIIVNSGGDNISPQRIEGFLVLEPEIAQAMVYGDRRPHLVALIVPDEQVAEDANVETKIGAALARANAGLSAIERVRHFIVADEPFSIDNEQMTPTLKLRRHVLKEIYGERLEALYRR